jgi:hypothetical protein
MFKPKHGMSFSPTYVTWTSMLQRCTNPKHKHYANYGGKGVQVCERWRDFRLFLEDMGERPAGMSIDRLANGKGYEPGNCRWATRADQNRNRSVCIHVALNGKTQTLMEWSRDLGVPETTLRRWHRLGRWPVQLTA